jgi:hypothetical protein
MASDLQKIIEITVLIIVCITFGWQAKGLLNGVGNDENNTPNQPGNGQAAE